MAKSTEQEIKIGRVNWIGLWTFFRRELERMLRVATQTLVAPLISATLFITIFGFILGTRIDTIAGVEYIKFVLPGIIMLNVITSSFAHSSSSLYMNRFMRSIEELLVAPFSHLEMIIGYAASGMARGIIVGILVLVVGLFFGAVTLLHPFLFLFYLAAVSIVFALVGMLVGLWAKGFEQLNILSTFVITPLSFLGGVFYSINMLPENVQPLAYFNPFFYFINGIRYSMIGVSEVNQWIGVAAIVGLIFALGGLVWYLFEKGWRLRE